MDTVSTGIEATRISTSAWRPFYGCEELKQLLVHVCYRGWSISKESKCHERFRFNLLEEAFTIFGLSAREVQWDSLQKKTCYNPGRVNNFYLICQKEELVRQAMLLRMDILGIQPSIGKGISDNSDLCQSYQNLSKSSLLT